MAVEALMKNPEGEMPMQQQAPMEAPMQGQEQPQPINVNPEEFKNALSNLSVPAAQALQQHLTPSVKNAMAELLGGQVAEILKDRGPDQPTVSIPVSVIATVYPADNIEQSIKMMEEDFKSKGQQDIPSAPQGGLGGAPMTDAPQTNVPPMPTA